MSESGALYLYKGWLERWKSAPDPESAYSILGNAVDLSWVPRELQQMTHAEKDNLISSAIEFGKQFQLPTSIINILKEESIDEDQMDEVEMVLRQCDELDRVIQLCNFLLHSYFNSNPHLHDDKLLIGLCDLRIKVRDLMQPLMSRIDITSVASRNLIGKRLEQRDQYGRALDWFTQLRDADTY